MKIGLQIAQFNFPGGEAAIGPGFAALARAADEGGFASLWVMDHFFQIGVNGPAEDPMLEAYSALSFAAGITTNVKLGAMVTGVTYRHPGVLAKTVSTLDVLSGGRAYLGIGAAWFEREHDALGVPFPPLKERFERLDDAVRAIEQMWSESNAAYEGTHYHLAETLNVPATISRPHPPILIGGGGEKKTLRLVAQYADACNLFPSPELPHKLEVLKAHCAEIGRDYAEIEKTTLTRAYPSPDDPSTIQSALEEIEYQASLGIDQVILNMGNLTDPAIVELAAREIVEPARAIEVAGRWESAAPIRA
jgi:F420-dependent oxidoreductase-like protein